MPLWLFPPLSPALLTRGCTNLPNGPSFRITCVKSRFDSHEVHGIGFCHPNLNGLIGTEKGKRSTDRNKQTPNAKKKNDPKNKMVLFHELFPTA